MLLSFGLAPHEPEEASCEETLVTYVGDWIVDNTGFACYFLDVEKIGFLAWAGKPFSRLINRSDVERQNLELS
jgi:hypothetical protein